VWLTGLVFLGMATTGARAAAETNWVLMRDDLRSEIIVPATIDQNRLTYRASDGRESQRINLASALVLFDEHAGRSSSDPGLLRLNDGQQFPGRILSNAQADSQVVAWNHDWLGRIEVPLDRIASITLENDQPRPEAGTADVVRLANGDRLEGFVTQIGDPLTIEVTSDGDTQRIDVPLQAVSAIVMVNRPVPATGQRLWRTDGTVVAVSELRLERDGRVHVATPWTKDSQTIKPLELAQIAAIQFSAGGMTPLAALEPTRVDGPPTRYVTPPPSALDPTALLGLSPIEFRGPVVVYYALPVGASRFAGTARVPESASDWADFEFIIRVNDSEAFRDRLNAENRRTTFNIPLHGSELTIELTEGADGPVLDQMILERAVLRIGSN